MESTTVTSTSSVTSDRSSDSDNDSTEDSNYDEAASPITQDMITSDTHDDQIVDDDSIDEEEYAKHLGDIQSATQEPITDTSQPRKITTQETDESKEYRELELFPSPYFDEMAQRSSNATLTRRFCMQTYFVDQPLLNIQQGGTAWIQQRSKIAITASNFAAVLGLLPFETSQKSYDKLLKQRDTDFTSPQWANVTWGKEMEGTARQFLRDHFFPEIREVGTFIYKPDPRLGATPDGLIVDGIRDKRLSLLEIKCPAKQGNFAQKGIPIWNLLQVYGEMASTGVDNTIFMSWLPQRFSLFYVTFDRRIWNSYVYPKLKDILDAMEQGKAWTPTMTIWKEELNEINTLLSENVFKICQFDDVKGHRGGLKWNLRHIIRDGEKIELRVSDVHHAQNISLDRTLAFTSHKLVSDTTKAGSISTISGPTLTTQPITPVLPPKFSSRADLKDFIHSHRYQPRATTTPTKGKQHHAQAMHKSARVSVKTPSSTLTSMLEPSTSSNKVDVRSLDPASRRKLREQLIREKEQAKELERLEKEKAIEDKLKEEALPEAEKEILRKQRDEEARKNRVPDLMAQRQAERRARQRRRQRNAVNNLVNRSRLG